MNDDLPIIDQSYPPKDPVEVKNENLFLKETKAHTEIPATERTSIILTLLIVGITLIIMFLSGPHDNSSPSASSENQPQEETKKTDDHTEEP